MERVKKNLEDSVRPGTSGKDFDLVVPIVKGCAVILRDPEESCDSGIWNHQLDLEEPASTWAGWFCATQLGADRDNQKTCSE
ncbi:hypothetical protein quinque_014434 [Culex quinquefasciatus]